MQQDLFYHLLLALTLRGISKARPWGLKFRAEALRHPLVLPKSCPVKSMTCLNKDKAPFTPQIPWQLLQASCWHLICSISFPWPNSSHAEAFAEQLKARLTDALKLFWTLMWNFPHSLHQRQCHSDLTAISTFIWLPMCQNVQKCRSVWPKLQGETMRSHCGISCLVLTLRG